MDSRPNLQDLFLTICNNVYFQPPESLKLNYPAIVFKLDDINNAFADNEIYKQSRCYKVTVIDKNPDSEIMTKVAKLPKTRFITSFQSANLNHYVFRIYYK